MPRAGEIAYDSNVTIYEKITLVVSDATSTLKARVIAGIPIEVEDVAWPSLYMA